MSPHTRALYAEVEGTGRPEAGLRTEDRGRRLTLMSFSPVEEPQAEDIVVDVT